jgi:hypothetical protein
LVLVVRLEFQTEPEHKEQVHLFRERHHLQQSLLRAVDMVGEHRVLKVETVVLEVEQEEMQTLLLRMELEILHQQAHHKETMVDMFLELAVLTVEVVAGQVKRAQMLLQVLQAEVMEEMVLHQLYQVKQLSILVAAVEELMEQEVAVERVEMEVVAQARLQETEL